jgi:demethylmenaquinone methyltransferase/2-methoxy-6-polyprenyl-1,4-benzoquinol methylase
MAETWDDRCRHDPERINEILDMLRIRAGDAVLDVGTGTGVLIPFLLERIGPKGRITAVDMAENMIRIAERKLPHENVCYMVADVLTTCFSPSSFDVILCYSVLPHFEDQRSAARQLASSLRAGGTLAICHSQGRDHINALHKTVSPAVAHDHLPEAQVVAAYLVEAGCEILRVVDTERLFVVAGRRW